MSPLCAFLGSLPLLLLGCSTPDHLDLCLDACDNLARCSPITFNDAQIINCHNDCNRNAGSYSSQDYTDAMTCSNAGDLHRRSADCYQNTCGLDLATCLGGVFTYCIRR